MHNSDHPTFVYIVARGHSGSTLLELLLNRSKNIAAMGEIDMLGLQIFRDHRTRWIGQCSCGERVYECSHWGKIISRVKSTYGADLIASPFSWRISDVGLEEEYGFRRPLSMIWYKFHRLIRSIAYSTDAGNAGPFNSVYQRWIENRDFVSLNYARDRSVKVVVDASKDPLQMRDILKYSKMNVKVLFLTRDVRGLVWSAIKRQRLTLEQEARDWSRLNGRILRLLEHVSETDWLQVKYEDLCSDTDQEMLKIHEFIGVERDPLSPEEERLKRHTAAGNAVRFKDLKSVREDLAWKDNLSEQQLRKIDAIAGDMASKLGYST